MNRDDHSSTLDPSQFRTYIYSDVFRNYLTDNFAEISERKRVVIDLEEVGRFCHELGEPFSQNPLLTHPLEEYPRVQAEVNDVCRQNGILTRREVIQVGFTGLSFSHDINLGGFSADFVGQMISVTGIVVRANMPVNRIVEVVLRDQDQHFVRRESYLDRRIAMNAVQSGQDARRLPRTVFPPERGDRDEPVYVHPDWANSDLIDYQELLIQELPELTPLGRTGRSLLVLCARDLVDNAKPGDRVRVTGVLKISAGMRNSASVNTSLLATHIKVIENERRRAAKAGEADELVFREFVANATRPEAPPDHLITTLSDSLAPTIFGHDAIKRAIILQLVGGCGYTVQNGGTTRGDIHILLCGDPGTAKSQMTRIAMEMSPISVQTTGSGSSAAGLTAAVMRDKSGALTLEAGAMVLADGGLLVVDEIDKMSDNDRVALHEAMEQQTVSINKGGISASLNAHTSVLAAANPRGGYWDRDRSVSTNITLPDTLLSRFDLIFLVLDPRQESFDSHVTHHVMMSHADKNVERPSMAALTSAASVIVEPILSIASREDSVMKNQGKEDATADYNDLTITAGLNDVRIRVYPKFEHESMDTLLQKRINQFIQANPQRNIDAAASINDFTPDEIQEIKSHLLVTSAFLRSYLQFAHNSPRPSLTRSASEAIRDEYLSMRQKSLLGSIKIPVTPRDLFALMRLTIAHAKLRLSDEATEMDARVAIELMHASIVGGVGINEGGNRRYDFGAPQPRVPAAAAPAEGEGEGQAAELLFVPQDEESTLQPQAGVPRPVVDSLLQVEPTTMAEPELTVEMPGSQWTDEDRARDANTLSSIIALNLDRFSASNRVTVAELEQIIADQNASLTVPVDVLLSGEPFATDGVLAQDENGQLTYFFI